MMSEEKLMPCPFCGGPARLWHQNKRQPHSAYVQCDESMCGTTKAGVGRTKAERETEAITAWNTRPAREEVSGEAIERLRIMSKQKLLSELDDDDREAADVEGGYDQLVKDARFVFAAMNPKPAEAASAQDVERAASIIRNWRAGNAGEDDANDTARLVLSLAATPATAKAVEPVAWMYEYTVRYQNKVECSRTLPPVVGFSAARWTEKQRAHWNETPLYAHPLAADVAGFREALPQDVVNLVIAGRGAWELLQSLAVQDPEVSEMDKALEAFASRVPYDDEPEGGWLAAPGESQ